MFNTIHNLYIGSTNLMSSGAKIAVAGVASSAVLAVALKALGHTKAAILVGKFVPAVALTVGAGTAAIGITGVALLTFATINAFSSR